MRNQTVNNNKTKPFARTRMLFATFLGVDNDENSGLDTYINNSNIQSEEDIENARIAQELKDSLSSIDARSIRDGKEQQTKKKFKQSFFKIRKN